jgi:hypothetical protein
MRLLPVIIILLLTGCAMQTGTTNFFTEPIFIRCKGEGKTSVIVGPYAGHIESQCGDGFEYSLERGRPSEVTK